MMLVLALTLSLQTIHCQDEVQIDEFSMFTPFCGTRMDTCGTAQRIQDSSCLIRFYNFVTIDRVTAIVCALYPKITPLIQDATSLNITFDNDTQRYVVHTEYGRFTSRWCDIDNVTALIAAWPEDCPVGNTPLTPLWVPIKRALDSGMRDVNAVIEMLVRMEIYLEEAWNDHAGDGLLEFLWCESMKAYTKALREKVERIAPLAERD